MSDSWGAVHTTDRFQFSTDGQTINILTGPDLNMYLADNLITKKDPDTAKNGLNKFMRNNPVDIDIINLQEGDSIKITPLGCNNDVVITKIPKEN